MILTHTRRSPRDGTLDISASNCTCSLAHSSLNSLGCRTGSVVQTIDCSCRGLPYAVSNMLDGATDAARQLIKALASHASDATDTRVYARGGRVEHGVSNACCRPHSLVHCSRRCVDPAADGAWLLRGNLAWSGMSFYHGEGSRPRTIDIHGLCRSSDGRRLGCGRGRAGSALHRRSC